MTVPEVATALVTVPEVATALVTVPEVATALVAENPVSLLLMLERGTSQIGSTTQSIAKGSPIGTRLPPRSLTGRLQLIR